MTAVRVPWTEASFLAYLGGLTILASVLALLGVQSSEHGAAGFAFWAAVIFGVLTGCAFAARNARHRVTAGLFALSSVGAFVIFVGAVFDWFGWLPDMNDDKVLTSGFHFWLLVTELSAVLASAVALRLFRFPLLVFVLAASSWLFVFDLLSNGGDWAAVLTIAIGLVLLVSAMTVDRGPSRDFGLWLHVAAGIALGGGLLWFFHDGDFDWIVVAVIGLGYFAVGNRLGRTSWLVLGAWGILQTAAHFAEKWSELTTTFLFFPLFPFALLSGLDGDYNEHRPHEWAGPFTFAVTGLIFIAIALFLARRSRPPIAEI
jgi:hypothetical protein